MVRTVARPVGEVVSAGTAVIVDAVIWAGWGVAVGLAAVRLPPTVLSADHWLTRIRPWEDQGRAWLKLGVRRWKDRLPEAGTLFGSVSKRALPAPTEAGLRAFAAETRRAEYVHWAALAPLAAMPCWNPWWLTAAMALYAGAANGPCIVVQRYNRGRIENVLERRPARWPATLPS
jgi:glycosyl-4,4'-diaponeurosporenoate acyltransferase